MNQKIGLESLLQAVPGPRGPKAHLTTALRLAERLRRRAGGEHRELTIVIGAHVRGQSWLLIADDTWRSLIRAAWCIVRWTLPGPPRLPLFDACRLLVHFWSLRRNQPWS